MPVHHLNPQVIPGPGGEAAGPGQRGDGMERGEECGSRLMNRRWFALIRDVEDPPEVRQWVTVGVTPAGTAISERLPWPAVVLLEEFPDAGAVATRFTRDGEFAGEDDEESVGEALRQLAFEYGDALGEWNEIPEDMADALSFALSEVRGHRGVT